METKRPLGHLMALEYHPLEKAAGTRVALVAQGAQFAARLPEHAWQWPP